MTRCFFFIYGETAEINRSHTDTINDLLSNSHSYMSRVVVISIILTLEPAASVERSAGHKICWTFLIK